MLGFMWTANTIDADLTKHGVAYDANIENVHRYYSKGHHTDVTASYKVNGRAYVLVHDQGDDGGRYQRGGQAVVRALPSNPTVHEPIDAPAGQQQSNDNYAAFLLGLLNLAIEGAIWLPAWRRNHLAKNGIPVLAKVEQTTISIGGKGEKYYKATVSYQVNGGHHVRTFGISASEYTTLHMGDTEIGLVDPHNNNDFVFYRFCCYQPVLNASSGNSATTQRSQP